jgi:tRNA/tmRNA/rRNA uracil-C5-methylase (TrmA/RlmC/RlmD family)
MLGRHDGRVVLVLGAIPGERVRARIERRSRDVFWARVEHVLTPSPDRRAPVVDPACAGMSYSHIACDAQRRLKAAVIADAFRRLGKITLPSDVVVDPSPEHGIVCAPGFTSRMIGSGSSARTLMRCVTPRLPGNSIPRPFPLLPRRYPSSAGAGPTAPR